MKRQNLEILFCLFLNAVVGLGGAYAQDASAQVSEQYCETSSRVRTLGGEQVLVVGEDDGLRLPNLRSPAVRPTYTEAAQIARIQGLVVVEVVISKDGKVVETHVCKGLPLGLTEKAVEAVRQWEFSVPEFHGTPVEVSHVVAVEFKLLPRPTVRAKELEVPFHKARAVEEGAVTEAGIILSDYIGPELNEEIRTYTIFFTPDGIFFNGTAVTDDALDRFVARLAHSGYLGEPSVAWTKGAEDGSVKFRVDLFYPTGR